MDPALGSRIAQARAEVAADPRNTALAVELGEISLEAEAYFEAADAFKLALERGDSNARVQAGLAAAYLELGYIKTCIEHLSECFRLDRDQPSCLLTLAGLMENDGRREALEEARRAYRRLLDVAPSHPRSAYARSMLEQLDGRLGPEPEDSEVESPADSAQPEGPAPTPTTTPPPAGAPSTSRGAADRGVPGHGQSVAGQDVGELKPFGRAIQKAFEARRQNDLPAAEKAYREALALEPNDPTALAGLAEILWAENQVESAVDAARKAIAQAPSDSEARYVFGLIMMKSGRDPKAGLAAWEAILRDDAEFATQMNLKASVDSLKRFTSEGSPHRGDAGRAATHAGDGGR